MISIIWGTENSQTVFKEQNGACQELENEGNGEMLVKGCQVPVIKMSKFWRSNVESCDYTNNAALYT